MGRNSSKTWSWTRPGHNPGLVRIKAGKKEIGLFHALPCSFLKASKHVDSRLSTASPILIREDDRKTPLSHALTRAMEKRIEETNRDESMDVKTPAPN